MVPKDCCQPKYFLGNGLDPDIGVSIRRPPEFGQASAGRVMNDFHGPTEFADEFHVGQSGHILLIT